MIASTWSLATALSLLAWYVFAPQCLSTLAVVKRETNSWRYPLLMAAWKVAPALVSGNTVVFKPATLTPATASSVVSVFGRAGLPPGVLNMVLGSGSVAGASAARWWPSESSPRPRGPWE